MTIGIKENDSKKIIIETQGSLFFGHSKFEDLTIRIGHRETKEYYLQIKSKGLREKCKTIIDKDTFDKLFENLLSIDFEKIYLENDDACDSGSMSFKITQNSGMLRYRKEITLAIIHNSEETNKLLKLYETIKELSGFSKYYELIEEKKIMLMPH